jgi:ribose 5-phosphate isomerase B
MTDIVAVAADHGGYDLKTALLPALKALGFEVLDLGTHSNESVDYPNFADAVAQALVDGKADRGLLICGTGIGISMAANRHRHVRCALAHDVTTARLARQHNDANVLALGGRVLGFETAKDCVDAFFKAKFEGGERHVRRIALFS